MNGSQPVLLLVVPADCEAVPEGVTELRLAHRDLTPRIEAAFCSLAWLELDGVS